MRLGIKPTVDFAFKNSSQAHHRFQMLDTASHRGLDNAIEVHAVELTKYNLTESTIAHASKLEQWAFLFLRAQDYDADSLRELLPGFEFETTIGSIEIISAKTEDKQMYDQREKAQRDYEWALSSAHEEGREEGKLSGAIQTLQRLLGDEVTPDSELMTSDLTKLTTQIAVLQQRLRDRQS